jgi:hypothetical protein
MIENLQEYVDLKITRAQVELYKCMKEKHESNIQFNKEDMLEIYNRFVFSKKRQSDFQRRRLTEDQVYNNASNWLNNAICRLIRTGYIGLTFEKSLNYIGELHNQDRIR